MLEDVGGISLLRKSAAVHVLDYIDASGKPREIYEKPSVMSWDELDSFV